MSSNDPTRHWHGSVGDRHEHLNVWVRGGPASTYMGQRPATSTTSAISGNDMSDRRGSAASDLSTSSASSTTGSSTSPPGRRRSSGHGPSTLFESLTSQKRNSEDANASARRASYNDQAPQGGFFSKLWDGYTKN